MKGSEKTIATANLLTDWCTFFRVGSPNIDRRIQFQNIVTNWNEIANKPSYYPFDQSLPAVVTGLWAFNVALKTKEKRYAAPGVDVVLDMTKGSVHYIEPNVNFNLSMGDIYEGDIVVIVKQPVAGNVAITFETDQFLLDNIPVLTSSGGAIDIMTFHRSDSLDKTIITSFKKDLQPS